MYSFTRDLYRRNLSIRNCKIKIKYTFSIQLQYKTINVPNNKNKISQQNKKTGLSTM